MQGLPGAALKKAAAGLLSALLLFVLLFSAFYIAEEHDHDCSGEDCPVCACILQCENTLHQMGSGVAVRTAVVTAIILILSVFVFSLPVSVQETLVSQKIRLND